MNEFAGMSREKIGYFMEKHPDGTMHFVYQNVLRLKEAGCYEHFLLMAYTGVAKNHAQISNEQMRDMFQNADRERLLAEGAPLPSTWPLRLFRGVSGDEPERREQGFSWTPCLDVACWFALRYGLRNPAVLVADVMADEIFAVHLQRSEQEFLALPREISYFDVSYPEMLKRKNDVSIRIKDGREAYLKELREQGVQFELAPPASNNSHA